MAGPTAAVITARTTSAAAIPWNVDFHSRVMPTASTMVRASTASTTQATKTVRISGRAFNRSPQLPRLVIRADPVAGGQEAGHRDAADNDADDPSDVPDARD